MAGAAFRFADYQMMVFPGGFAYGDDLGAGRVLASELNLKLREEIEPFIERGGLVLGVCNGFQTLVKAGILPGPMSKGQTVTLTNNDSGRFECRWVYLTANPKSKCVFTRGIERSTCRWPTARASWWPPEVIESLDVALYYTNAEGKSTPAIPTTPTAR